MSSDKKVVGVGSVVVVEEYQMRREISIEGLKHAQIETWVRISNPNCREVNGSNKKGCYVYKITKTPSSNSYFEIHPESFHGEALIGARVGDEREVNVGGPPKSDIRIGHLSGYHFKLKVISIDPIQLFIV